MKLKIDTSGTEKIKISLDGKTYSTSSRKQKSQKLLGFIVEKLEEKKTDLKNITEIEVVLGPGSFTGLRVGVSVANALGYALKIPVNGKDILKVGPVTPTY